MSELETTQTPFEAIRQVDEEGVEYWWARDLMVLMGYAQWRHFNLAIGRARATMANQGTYDPKDHFWSIRRPAGSYSRTSDINAGQGGGRTSLDFRLTREACYHIAIDGDPMKPEIKAAKQYFVLQTMKMEQVERQVSQVMPTHVEALRGWADALEAKQRAELQAAEAKAEADMLRPPAEAWESLADVGQDYSVREAAYILMRDESIAHLVGPQKLFRWLVDHGMAQRKPDGQYVPYAVHADRLRLKPQSRPDYDSDEPGIRKEANAQLRITVKGLEWIQQRMRDQTRPALLASIPVQRVPETEAPIDFDKYRMGQFRALRATLRSR